MSEQTSKPESMETIRIRQECFNLLSLLTIDGLREAREDLGHIEEFYRIHRKVMTVPQHHRIPVIIGEPYTRPIFTIEE